MTPEADPPASSSSDQPQAAPTENGAVDPPAPPSGGPIVSFFKSTIVQLGAAVVAFLVAAVSGWLQPLADLIKDQLWQEQVEIGEEIAAQEHVERELRFILQTKTRAGLSGGSVTVSSPDRTIGFGGNARFTVGPSEGSVTVPAPNELKITPGAGGTHKVHVVLETNRGKKFEGDINVVVTGQEASLYVGLAKKWTGKWHATVNRVQGSMDIVEDNNQHMSGSAAFHNGAKYRINPDSWHDGDGFLLLLEGDRQQLSLQGVPCEVTDDQKRKSRVLNGRAEISIGTKLIKRPMGLGAIVQQCPGMKARLSETPGDGAFEAFIYPK